MIDSVSGASPAVPAATPAPAVNRADDPSHGTTLEVSRAASAPVYVYRVTDTSTGRTLVEIPRRGDDYAPVQTGRNLDTTA